MPNIEFSAADKIKIQVVEQEIAPDTFDDSQLPTDIHIVTYTYEGRELFDVVRAYTMVDIFDAYFDKLGDKGRVTRIRNGYGKIKPKLYGKIKQE